MMKKKYIAIFLLISIIGSNLVIPPKKAHAFLGIADFGFNIDVVQQAIKLTFNTAAHAIARQVVASLVKSTVTWINAGYPSGGPSFVQDPKQFFTNSANNSADAFVRNIDNGKLGLLCSPFQKQIQLSLIDYYYQPANEQLQCTWTGIAGNLQSFMAGNFSAGGWDGFISMTQVPTNNVYGAGIQAEIALSSQVADVVGLKKTDYTVNQGFLNLPGDCLANNPDQATIDNIENGGNADNPIEETGKYDTSDLGGDDSGTQYDVAGQRIGDNGTPEDTPDVSYLTVGDDLTSTEIGKALSQNEILYNPNKGAGTCIAYGPTKTPGSVISSQLNSTLHASTDQLINGHDWDEIVSALVNSLTKKIFSTTVGLFSSNPTEGLPDGTSGSAVSYTGPTSSNLSSNIPDTDGPTDPRLSCTADTQTAFASNPATIVTWKAVSTVDGVTDYEWSGNKPEDEIANAASYDPALRYATGTSISLVYKIPTPDAGYFNTAGGSATSTDQGLVDTSTNQSYTYKTMSVTAHTTTTDANGQSVPLTIGPVLCRTQVQVTQYHPLVASCSPKSDIVHTPLNKPVSWVATISGGSGKFQEIQWDGQQSHYPKHDDDQWRMFPRNIKDPTVPFIAWLYGALDTSGHGTPSFDTSFKGKASDGITTQEFTKNPNGTYTSTLTRVYVSAGSPIGDADANIEVVDSDPTIPVVLQGCAGTIHIDDN